MGTVLFLIFAAACGLFIYKPSILFKTRSISRKNAIGYVILATLVWLFAYGAVVGPEAKPNYLPEIKEVIGKNKSQVQSILGTPSKCSVLHGGETCFYEKGETTIGFIGGKADHISVRDVGKHVRMKAASIVVVDLMIMDLPSIETDEVIGWIDVNGLRSVALIGRDGFVDHIRINAFTNEDGMPAFTKERAQAIAKKVFDSEGKNDTLVDAVKKSMNDPDSFQHVETEHVLMPPGFIGIKMKFRGKNGFGATVINTVYASMDLDGRIVEIKTAP